MFQDEEMPVNKRDLNRGFRMWGEGEVKTAEDQEDRYIANVNDAIFSWTTGISRVTYVDPITHVAKHVPHNFVGVNGPSPNIGGGLRTFTNINEGDMFRLYVDNSVSPVRAAIDTRLFISGVEADKVKIFLGTNITETGKILSVQYVSDSPTADFFSLAEIKYDDDEVGVKTFKVPLEAHLIEKVKDGEPLTAVIYNQSNLVTGITTLYAKETQFIASGNATIKHVTNIALSSPYLSKSDPNLVEFPHNVPIENLQMRTVVSYSDGSKDELAVDGLESQLLGSDVYIPSVAGHNTPMVLKYKLRPGERSFSKLLVNDAMQRKYTFKTVDLDNNYNMKLFVAPQWQSSAEGYKLRFYIFNAKRDLFQDVTDHVVIDADAGPAFRPNSYGIAQDLVLTIKLNKVKQGFGEFTHTQNVRVTLLGEPTEYDTPWRIDYRGDGAMVFGEKAHAEVKPHPSEDGKFNVKICVEDVDNLDDWLNATYFNTYPLVLHGVESTPPKPTHFKLVVGSESFERPIEDWNKEVLIDQNHPNTCPVDILWIQRTQAKDIYLAISTFNMVK